MTTQLTEIFLSDSQLFKTSVYDVDGVTLVTPLQCACSIWNRDTGAVVISAQAGTVGAGYAQYNWSGSATAGNYEAILTVTISVGVIKSEDFLVTVLEKPSDRVCILTNAEAANFLRTEATNPVMLQLLPLVDQCLMDATGHNWSRDAIIHPTAKLAAGITLIQWYDNPSNIGQLPAALSSALIQLEAEAMKYRKYHFEGASGTGSICLPGAREGDVVLSLTGVYGLSGDQSTLFESSVSEENFLVQTSSSDLSEKQFVVVLKHPADDVNA